MRIIEKSYKGYKPLYPLERICDPAGALFIDIETTGLKKETTSLYLIGCGQYTDEGFLTRLFFADTHEEEEDVLISFLDYMKDFTHLLHFNGTKFDIPYLQYKFKRYGISDPFTKIAQVDIYKLCKPLRYLLFPESMRQKAIESFLGISREDMYGGGELIEVYKDFEITGSDDDLKLLVTHNREDVLGMHLILPILYYLDLQDMSLSFEDYTINEYRDYKDSLREEVIFNYTTDVAFPISFTAKTDTMYVRASADNKKISIRLPIYDQDMYIFFDNYRDYCYIPDEDRAILRTVACALPKDRYKKATKETCYQRFSGRCIKQPHAIFKPVLKTCYKDKKMYFRFPEDFNKEAAEEFGRSLINVFFKTRKNLSLL